METPEKPKLKVTDRRQFTREGERRPDAAEPEARTAPAAERPRPTQDPLSIDFGRLVLSLARQTLMLLGEEPNPMEGRIEADLEGARETIDILMLLRVKTHGNLTPEEGALLEQMIYELQMKYAQKTRR